ncbi:alpha/beta hydrolase [Nocardioides sp. cx-173]|uniref:alpha/beta hydrolase n=1 Tax=Nocardioides sp. cx-173 TaxID=2898796 RepID=UPI001E48CC4F|nr:alpha/beta hydrolase [Nocardioides sp. cx-173]MCD4523381.1 alpha/beta hydrolase [Nocardioides sp. cx-173]UGB42280.1 alpha/beta hydrolase [Nocardioides sp. cx-173]
MTRTVRIVVVALIVLALIGSGWLGVMYLLLGDDSDGGSADPSPTVVTTSPAEGATDAPSPGLAPYYSQQIDWEACGSNQCGTLTVPVDYRDPGGETIELNLLKVPAGDPEARVGSLVVNPGGPGAPGTSYAEQARQVFREPLTQAFDVVGFDPRGTGRSAPLDCLPDDELTEFLAVDPAPDDAAEEQELVDDLADFWQGCAERSDTLVGHVTTAETARDMDVLRAALGEASLYYLGASYGTKLGATYAELFPDRVGRFVLDGAVDVGLPSRAQSLGQARGFEVALRAYVEDCVEKGDCVLGDSVEEGLDTISELIDDIDAEPLPTSDGRELTVGSAFYGIVTPLYNRDYWRLLDQGLSTALEGDGTTLMLLADAYASRQGGRYLDNSTEAIYAINCLDDPYYVEPDEVEAQVPAFEKVSPTFGRVFAWGLVNCKGIEVASSEPPLDIRGEGAPPILVVGTTRDPATPYEWAVALAERLESGVLLTRDGDGHTAYNAGNECIDTTIEDYLIDDVVPDDGTEC